MKTNANERPESIHIDEDFIAIDNRPLDSRNRITLSDQVVKALAQKTRKIDSFEILVGPNGEVLLRPKISIPANEAWIYEDPHVLKTLGKAMQQVKEGKVAKVKDQQKFFDSL